MLPHTLRYFFMYPSPDNSRQLLWKAQELLLIDEAQHSSAKSISHSPYTAAQAQPDPNSCKKRSGWNMQLLCQKRTENLEREERSCIFMWSGRKRRRCSLLMFLFYFSKVCTEKQFQEKVLTCPGNLPISRDQWLFPFSFPLLPPSSCCFCSPIYLLLVYTFQLLFPALALAFLPSQYSVTSSYTTQHILYKTVLFIRKAWCLLLRSTIFRWEGLIPCSKRQPCLSHLHT